jgi:hypothetical protein
MTAVSNPGGSSDLLSVKRCDEIGQPFLNARLELWTIVPVQASGWTLRGIGARYFSVVASEVRL